MENAGAELETIPSARPERFLGKTLAERYQIISIVGQGAMGVVFRAHQLGVDRDVAVKVLHPKLAADLESVKRFEKEARAISALRHPNTLRLYDCQRTHQGEVFIVTELLTGRPLARLLEQAGRLLPARASAVVDQICRSLGEAHAAGIIHRDLKPENVFLDHVGGEEVVKVLDFGIAKIIDPRVTSTTTVGLKGTPRYMSPEQANSEAIDQRSDIYSLGVMLYEMIAGRPPFHSESMMRLLHAHIYEAPPPLEPSLKVPPELERLIFDMLAKSPDDRPSSVEQVRARLAGRAQDLAETRLVSPSPLPRAPRRRTAIAAAMVSLALLAAAWFALLEEEPAPVTPEPPRAEIRPPAPPIVPIAPAVEPEPPPPEVKRVPRVRKAKTVRKKRPNDLLPVKID